MNETQNNSTLPPQNKRPVQSKSLLTSILLLLLPTPLWLISMSIVNHEGLAQWSTGFSTTWLALPVHGVMLLLFILAYILLPLAILPCFFIGIGLQIKHNKTPQPKDITDTNANISGLPPKQKSKGMPWLLITMLILWILVPIGFFLAWFAEGLSKGLNNCDLHASRDYCQPSHLGIYFVIYIAVAGSITAYSTLKGKL